MLFSGGLQAFLCPFSRTTNRIGTSPLKTRKKNRDLKMGFYAGPFRAKNYRDRVIPWSYFTLLIVLIVVRAPSPAPPFKWRPEFPNRLSDQVPAHRLLEPHWWQPRRRNVAVAAYLRTCGWHRILGPAWDMAWRNTSSNICHDLIEELEPRGWAGGGLVTETLLFFKHKFCVW